MPRVNTKAAAGTTKLFFLYAPLLQTPIKKLPLFPSCKDLKEEMKPVETEQKIERT